MDVGWDRHLLCLRLQPLPKIGAVTTAAAFPLPSLPNNLYNPPSPSYSLCPTLYPPNIVSVPQPASLPPHHIFAQYQQAPSTVQPGTLGTAPTQPYCSSMHPAWLLQGPGLGHAPCLRLEWRWSLLAWSKGK